MWLLCAVFPFHSSASDAPPPLQLPLLQEHVLRLHAVLVQCPTPNISTAFLYRFDPMSGTMSCALGQCSLCTSIPTPNISTGWWYCLDIVNRYDLYAQMLFSVVFSAVPIIVYGITERDIDSSALLARPHLYAQGTSPPPPLTHYCFPLLSLPPPLLPPLSPLSLPFFPPLRMALAFEKKFLRFVSSTHTHFPAIPL